MMPFVDTFISPSPHCFNVGVLQDDGGGRGATPSQLWEITEYFSQIVGKDCVCKLRLSQFNYHNLN